MQNNEPANYWNVNFSQVLLVAVLMFMVKRSSSILLRSEHYFTVGLLFGPDTTSNPWGPTLALLIDLFLHLIVGITVGILFQVNPEGTAGSGIIVYRLFLMSPILFYWNEILGDIVGQPENRLPFLLIYFLHFVATVLIAFGGAKVGLTLRNWYTQKFSTVKITDILKQLYSKEILTGIVINLISGILLKFLLK